jgi:hypothetical protein
LAQACKLIPVLFAFHVAQMANQLDEVALIELTIGLPLHGSGV